MGKRKPIDPEILRASRERANMAYAQALALMDKLCERDPQWVKREIELPHNRRQVWYVNGSESITIELKIDTPDVDLTGQAQPTRIRA